MVDKFWITMFERERLSIESRYRNLIEVSARLVRELVRLKGLVRDDQLMMDSSRVEAHWEVPITYYHPHPPGPVFIREANISIGPSRARSFADPHVMEWVGVMEVIAARIGIFKTKKGLRGIYQLLDPAHTQRMFPSYEEIVAYERYQMENILQVQIDKGTISSIKQLIQPKTNEGVSIQEAKRSLRLARAIAPEITQSTIEEEKALMILRIEKVIQDAKQSQDTRAELQALKLLTFVQGLHRVSGDDTMQELIKIIKQTGAKFDKPNKTLDAITVEPEEEKLLNEPIEEVQVDIDNND